MSFWNQHSTLENIFKYSHIHILLCPLEILFFSKAYKLVCSPDLFLFLQLYFHLNDKSRDLYLKLDISPTYSSDFLQSLNPSILYFSKPSPPFLLLLYWGYILTFIKVLTIIIVEFTPYHSPLSPLLSFLE
jgi:hypothetical protein